LGHIIAVNKHYTSAFPGTPFRPRPENSLFCHRPLSTTKKVMAAGRATKRTKKLQKNGKENKESSENKKGNK